MWRKRPWHLEFSAACAASDVPILPPGCRRNFLVTKLEPRCPARLGCAALLAVAPFLLLATSESPSLAAAPIDPPTPQIWLGAGARTATPQTAVTLATRQDRGDMWVPNAPWQTVASHVQVVLFSPGNIQASTTPISLRHSPPAPPPHRPGPTKSLTGRG
jgi:hypothetical protein